MSFKFLKSTLSASAILLATLSTNAYSLDVNSGALVGSLNTTVSSGFSMRAEERDCKMLDGYVYTESDSTGATAIANIIAGRQLAGNTGAESSNLTTSISGSGGGCATYRNDAYGNTTNKFLDVYGNTNNDGNLNYNQGDIFSATQKIYSEFTGTLNGTTGLKISGVGSFNPALDISSPRFQQLNTEAEDAFESDFTILDAYITESFEAGDTFIDVQAGRYVTSWGEATFLPIGMNGLVTNALDLSKIRAPGSSIKEALMPTETLSVNFGMPDGSGLEIYTQFSHDRVQLDPHGAYFGSEAFGDGARSLQSTSPYYRERMSPEACPHMMAGAAAALADGFAAGGGIECTQANAALYAQKESDDTWKTYDTTALAFAGFGEMTATEWTYARLVGLGHEFTANQDALTGVGYNGLTNAGSAGNLAASASGAAAAVNTAYDGIADSARFDKSATVDVFPSSSGLFKEASDDGQYGIRWSKYLDNVGTGVDIGLYYANYHSKLPYVQFSMPGNIFASDVLGAYLLAAGDGQGSLDTAAGNNLLVSDEAGAYELNGTQKVHQALSNAALSAALCSAVMKGNTKAVVGGVFSSDSNSMREGLLIDAYFTDQFANGDRAHDPSECHAHIETLGNVAAATNTTDLNESGGVDEVDAALAKTAAKSAIIAGLNGTGARLFAAVTPINMITYQGIFPEDNQIFAASFSTNIGATTVQGELAYRPDFPLATDASDQINQLNDKSGANDALNFTAIAGADAAAAAYEVGSGDGIAAYATGVQNAAGLPADTYYTLVANFERSTLGDVVDANHNATSDLTSRYYSKAYIEYDTWSGSLGTTTSYPASHPVTQGLGADSSVLLTEIGFVAIDGLDNTANGFVARGGANEGPANGTTKCLGAAGSSYANLSAAGAAITNLGAGIVDALFGNGGFCEASPGADDLAWTYRVVGTANYSNFMNSPWSLSPNFSWAHDPSGNGPSSLGGFVEDRMTLSLGASLNKGGTSVSGSYVSYINDEIAQQSSDKDYVSLSVTHSF